MWAKKILKWLKPCAYLWFVNNATLTPPKIHDFYPNFSYKTRLNELRTPCKIGFWFDSFFYQHQLFFQFKRRRHKKTRFCLWWWQAIIALDAQQINTVLASGQHLNSDHRHKVGHAEKRFLGWQTLLLISRIVKKNNRSCIWNKIYICANSLIK